MAVLPIKKIRKRKKKFKTFWHHQQTPGNHAGYYRILPLQSSSMATEILTLWGLTLTAQCMKVAIVGFFGENF